MLSDGSLLSPFHLSTFLSWCRLFIVALFLFYHHSTKSSWYQSYWEFLRQQFQAVTLAWAFNKTKCFYQGSLLPSLFFVLLSMIGNSVYFQVTDVGYLRLQSLQFTAACPAGRYKYSLETTQLFYSTVPEKWKTASCKLQSIFMDVESHSTRSESDYILLCFFSYHILPCRCYRR